MSATSEKLSDINNFLGLFFCIAPFLNSNHDHKYRYVKARNKKTKNHINNNLILSSTPYLKMNR